MAIETLQQLRNKVYGTPDTSDEGMQENSIGNEVTKIPGYALNAGIELPFNLWNMATQVPGAVGKILSHPIDSARDIGGGIMRGEQRLASSGLEAGEYLTRKGAEGLLHATGHKDATVPKWNAREFMGLGEDRPVDLGGMIESNNPNELLSGIGQYGLGMSSLGTKIPALIGAGAMTNAIQAYPGQRIRGATEGAINTALPIGAGKVIAKTGDALRPSNLFRGTLSPEDLKANLEAAQGTNTGLGSVIDSPTLKRLQENVLTHVPFSGAYTNMQKTAQQFTEKGSSLMEKIGEDLPPGDKTKILKDAINDATKEARKEDQENYKNVDKISSDIGLIIGREKFSSKANEILSDIEKSPELKREFPKDLLSDIKQYAENRNGNSLKLSNIFKGKLNDKAGEFYENGKNYEYGLMRGLKDALGEDIDLGIKNSNHPALQNAYELAQKNHGEYSQQFEHPDIVKFTRKGGDPDLMLSHFLRTGANDRGELIKRLTTKLPTKLQNLPAYMYLSRAIEDGKLDPVKLHTLYDKLGENQRKALIPDKIMRKEIENYTRGVGMNKESFQTMSNPKTGQRNLDTLVGVLETIAGYSLAGAKGAALAFPAVSVAGRMANKRLTSEKTRTNLVKEMLKKKK